MCWYGKATPKIAKDDIPCKKIVGKHETKRNVYVPFFRSPYTDMTYHIGKTYMAKVGISYYIDLSTVFRRNEDLITTGIHCYANDVKIFDSKPLGYKTVKIGRFNTLYTYKNNPVVLCCIIPKGTVYYENEYGEIVTEKLRIVDVE
jgi:hypothetical protein